MNRWKKMLALAPLGLVMLPVAPAEAAPTVVNVGTYDRTTRFAAWTCSAANAGSFRLTGCSLSEGASTYNSYAGVVAPGAGSYGGFGAGSTITAAHGDFWVCADYTYGFGSTGRTCTHTVTT